MHGLIQRNHNIFTSFISSYSDDGSVWSHLNSVCPYSAMVGVVGMKRSHNKFSCVRISGVLKQVSCLSFCDIDPVLPDDPIDVFRWGRVPGQVDVCGVESSSGNVGGLTSGSCTDIKKKPTTQQQQKPFMLYCSKFLSVSQQTRRLEILIHLYVW